MTVPTSNAAARPQGQGASSSATRRSCRRRTRAAIRSSSRAARARSSRTWTATSSSTARPASPSTPPGIRIRTSCRAITEQAQKFLHMSGTDFYYEPQVRLAEELAALAPIAGGVRSFFGNSGTEAIEACIKLARYATRRPEHHRVSRRLSRPHAGIAVADGEQGDPAPRLRTAHARRVSRAVSGLLSLSGRPRRRRLRGASASTSSSTSCSCTWSRPTKSRRSSSSRSRARAATSSRRTQFLQRLRELTTQHGILLVVDEVQSGMGRTGKMFAIEHFGVEPDIDRDRQGDRVGAAARRRRARAPELMAWPPGAHASTFGGNPVSCAAALATITLLKEQLMANAADVGAHLMTGLEALPDKHPLIGDVRGRGLMIGVELVRDRQTKERAIERAQRRRQRRVPARPADPRRRQERDPLLAAAGADEGAGRHRGADLRRGADGGRAIAKMNRESRRLAVDAGPCVLRVCVSCAW